MQPFTADRLLDCYRRGVFPMADSRDDPRIFLIEPDRRGVLPLARFHIPARLARTVRQDRYRVRCDSAFADVLDGCAAATPGREETWINTPIRRLYLELYQRGHAHSIECWDGDTLAGGVYGVCIGAAFFGESMFSRARDASKVALVHLMARLKIGGYQLVDTQFITDHLRQFGTEDMARDSYRVLLDAAIALHADFFQWPPTATGADALRVLSACRNV